MGDAGDTTWTGIAAFETRFFAVSHCRSLRGHTFCVNRKYAKSHNRGGDCDFPAPFETPPLNRQRGTVRGSPLIPSKGWQSFSKPASFFVPSLFFAKKSVSNVKHCTNLRGFQKGDRNPTSVVAGEGSQGEGESKHPLPVRLFGMPSVNKREYGFDGQKCAHTSSKPLPIHKVLPAAFSLSERISAPSKLLRT